MAIPSTRYQRVHVQFILRKTLKRRSRRTKNRKYTNKSTHITRSLITLSLLKQSVRFAHVSVIRNPTSSTKKTVKNQSKKKQNSSQTHITNQQQVCNNETQHDNIRSFDHTQRRNSTDNIQVFGTVKQVHCAKLNSYNDQHLTVLESSSYPIKNINSTIDKIVLPTSRILSSNQTHHLIPSSLQESSKKDVNLLHDTTATLPISLINKNFSTRTKSNKKPSVHPNNEQQDQSLSQKKKKRLFSPCNIVVASILVAFLIGGMIIAIVIPLTLSKNKATVSINTSVPTTTSTPVCNTNSYMACSTLMYQNLNTNYIPPGAWTLVSCCYTTPSVNQITIEFSVQEDDSGYWMLDDISATQGNGEFVSNGGFEYNMTNWTLIVYSNASSTTAVDSLSGTSHTGIAYLYGASMQAPVYVQQTFSIIQGQNVLISFW